ncbi:hypothetical protein [Hasllibacter halocynthiae]|uniref:hypothetical protein n=1 Tax=Hasllibacter halocynthiae TaxID=595589 RepID=UPI000D06E1BD|nr:hypothetical protein [Hasllibacter halocynthiae]
MRNIGSYADLLAGALEGARTLQRHADARAEGAARAYAARPEQGTRERLRMAEIARAAARCEAAELEEAHPFPELIEEDEAPFPELVH